MSPRRFINNSKVVWRLTTTPVRNEWDLAFQLPLFLYGGIGREVIFGE
jgi:hypothetical protein